MGRGLGNEPCNFIIWLGATRLAGRGIHRACRAGVGRADGLEPHAARSFARAGPEALAREHAFPDGAILRACGPEAEGGPSRQPPAGEAPAERIRRNSGDTPGGV